MNEKGFCWQECIGATGYTVKIDGIEHTLSQPKYDITLEENTTYVVNIKVNYGQQSSEYSQNFAFHALKSPESLTINENTSNKQFTFSWERADCSVDTGYSLYYRSGEKVTLIASGITAKTYSTSFSTFKDKIIDGVYVAATDTRADCIALDKSNEVQLTAQITTLKKPSGFYINGNTIVWDDVAGSDEYSLTGVGSSTTAVRNFDASSSYTMSVVATSRSPYRSDSPAANYAFYKHTAPTNLKMTGSVLSFSGNVKSLLYEVKFQDNMFITSNFSLDLSEHTSELEAGKYSVSVRALPSGFVPNEIQSQSAVVTFDVFAANFTLNNTTLSWSAISGVTGYRVRINDGEWTDNGNSRSISIMSDTLKVEVEPYPINEEALFVNSIAKIIILEYDVNGGTPIVNSARRLVGTAIGTLPNVKLYDINADWYDSADPQTRQGVTASTIITKDTTIYADYYDIIQYDTSGTFATVTGLLENPSSAFSAVIRPTKNGKPVTAIANNAFKDKTKLTSLVIPDSITSIGEYAFSGSGLTSLIIPNNVASIGQASFLNCSNLASIILGNGIDIINNKMFENCSKLSGVSIPETVKNINVMAFRGCSSLKDVYIGSGVTNISSEAFYGCTSLTSINIPSNVYSLSNSAFFGCSNLKNVTLSKSVRALGMWAFNGCSSLTNITYYDTKANWQTMRKEDRWNEGTGNYTVTCTDGTLTKAES